MNFTRQSGPQIPNTWRHSKAREVVLRLSLSRNPPDINLGKSVQESRFIDLYFQVNILFFFPEKYTRLIVKRTRLNLLALD